MTGHVGSLLGGEVICMCGWPSGQHSSADDAVKAFDEHAEEADD